MTEKRDREKWKEIKWIRLGYSSHAAAGIYEGSEEERVAKREQGGNNEKHNQTGDLGQRGCGGARTKEFWPPFMKPASSLMKKRRGYSRKFSSVVFTEPIHLEVTSNLQRNWNIFWDFNEFMMFSEPLIHYTPWFLCCGFQRLFLDTSPQFEVIYYEQRLAYLNTDGHGATLSVF